MSDATPAAAELSPVKQALLEIRRLRARLADREPEPAAIIGMAVRFPGGIACLDDFWNCLAAGDSAVTPTPADRWDSAALFDDDADRPGKTYSRHGGFLTGIDRFDAEFFGITPREAESMDPQHRILLELTWEALEHAGIPATKLAGTNAGVFIGLSNSDYGRLLFETEEDIDAWSGFGLASSVSAGRISYFLDARGPSLVVDTACSSALMAIHLACQSLAAGQSSLAIAGAANLILTPGVTISFSHARMLSRDGRCKTFDADADGYVRGEGCAVVILKRLHDARADGDRVLAVIRGTAANHDGRSAGLTAPNGPAQTAVIQAALRDARLTAADIDYVEAHGTGTPLGDPIELQALGAAYGEGRPAARPLLVGSVKTNIGHLEAAAGLAGLAKVVLALGHESLPPHRNFATPNPHVAWDGLPVAIVRTSRPWPRTDRPRRAGVSSFGFSGTNVHVILEEAPSPIVDDTAEPAARRDCLFVISARSADALRELAGRYVAWLDRTEVPLADICHAAATGRVHHRHRLAAIARDPAALADELKAWLAGGVSGRVSVGIADAVPEIAARPITVSGASSNTAWTGMLEALRTGWLTGAAPDWETLYRSDASERRGPKPELPTYPFQRQRFWRPGGSLTSAAPAAADWPKLAATVADQSKTGPLGWDPTAYPTRWRRLEELTAGHAINTLVELGEFGHPGARASADDLVRRHGFVPRYRGLLRRWLKLLEREGLLHEDDGVFLARSPLRRCDLDAIWVDVERLLSDDPEALSYGRRTSGRLLDLLKGRADPLEFLFAGGSLDRAEGLYETSPSARYVNAMAAAAVRSALEDHRGGGPFRLVEAGAGVGGTTAHLSGIFPPDGEYWFTDLSDAFLGRARRRFGKSPAFRFAKFNLELPPPAELPVGRADVVLAANVVHATRDAGASIDHLRSLLKPGGLLVLIEPTTHHSYFDMTIGFIEGWSNFADNYRIDHPLLAADRWTSLLRERGFVEAKRFPGPGAIADNVGQHVVIGRRGTDARSDQAPRPIAAEALAAESGTAPPPRFAGPIRAGRRHELERFVRLCAAWVMHLDPATGPGPRERFTDLGMDSLMAVQLQGVLAGGLGLAEELPATIAFDTGTVEGLTDLILRLADPDLTKPEPDRPIVPNAMPGLFSAADLEAISDDEVAALLAQRINANSMLVKR